MLKYNKNAVNLTATPSLPSLKPSKVLEGDLGENAPPQKIISDGPLKSTLNDGPLKPQKEDLLNEKLKDIKQKLTSALSNHVINVREQFQPQPPPQLQPQQVEKKTSRIPRLVFNEPVNRRAPERLMSLRQRSGDKTEARTGQPASKKASIDKVKAVEIEDIDKPNGRDAIFQVSDLAKDIYDYMYELEAEQSIQEDYLRDQKILTPKVRQRLVNWCIEIHSTLKLLPETLYMTIAVMDRYFDRITVKQQNQVQLVAVGATLIASKYEEIYPPDIGDLLYLTQNAYSKGDIMRIELDMLKKLNYSLGRPIPLAFLRRFSRAAKSDLKMHSIAKFLMELSLSEYECSHWRPSMLAAAALLVTVSITDRDSSPLSSSNNDGLLTRRAPRTRPEDRWTPTLAHYTKYSLQDLLEPASSLCKIVRRVLRSPSSYTSYKKHSKDLHDWPELRSSRIDDIIKLAS